MNKEKSFKISSRFLVSLGVVFSLAAVSVIGLVNHKARQQALTEAKLKSRIILERNLATHTYFSHKLKPKLFQLTEPIRSEAYFEPTWMSSTYAVREIDNYFKSLNNSDYYYKECAVNARNPHNEADTHERRFIRELNGNPELTERSEIRDMGGKPYFVTMRRGEVMEASCLRCHTSPDRAPADLVRTTARSEVSTGNRAKWFPQFQSEFRYLRPTPGQTNSLSNSPYSC